MVVSALAAAMYGATPQEAVRAFSEAQSLPSGSMSVLVSDLASGDIIASYNIDKPLVPASIMKAATIAALTEEVDVEEPIETYVFIDGEVNADGLLEGNLIIEAKGDPSVNSTVWPKGSNFISEIISELKKMGINGISGEVLVDESYFAGPSVPPSWARGDLAQSYGTGSHAFNYSNNAVGKRSVGNPSEAFSRDLVAMMLRDGIFFERATRREGKRTLILTHKSPEMKELMRSCMMRSDNLFAESFLRRFGKERGGDGSISDSAEREIKFWKGKGLDMEGVRIVDGSGLSRSNRVTAKFMEGVLRSKASDVEYASFLPLAGQEGTLKRLLADTALDSYIAMKTGSMNGIQCYAGYKLDDDFAPTHVVVIMVNDFRCSRAYLRTQVERMLLDIFTEENMPSLKLQQKFRENPSPLR